MRLSLATSALLTLPIVSSEELLAHHQQDHEVTTQRVKPAAGQRRMLKNTLYNSYATQRGYPPKNSLSMPRLGQTDSGIENKNTGVLKNKNKKSRTLQANTECDPTADVFDADTGILQECGGAYDLICVPQETSTMGGLCIPVDEYRADLSNQLTDALTEMVASSLFAVHCMDDGDCGCTSDLDVTAGSGTVECTKSFCVDGTDCELCASKTQTFVFEGNTITKASVCGTVLQPYEQSYCYTIVYAVEDTTTTTCEMSIGGRTCASCDYSTDCTTFDCTNTVPEGQEGNTCTDFLLPILEEIDTLVINNDGEMFDPDTAMCEHVLVSNVLVSMTPGSAAAAAAAAPGWSGKIVGSLLVASVTLATIMVVRYLIS
jgi:hypothetical protein